jgi:hypothetical protein
VSQRSLRRFFAALLEAVMALTHAATAVRGKEGLLASNGETLMGKEGKIAITGWIRG